MISLTKKDQFQQIWRAAQHNRLPHALLFVGVKGTHKSKLADGFSRALLCEQTSTDGEACSKCHACRLLEGRVHPGVLWVEPEKAESAIKIDQIRSVNEFISQTSLQGKYKIVIIHPADDMNVNAANALLKTLEEPSSNSLIILISDHNGRLPATVLSRCQRIVFPRPDAEETLAWMGNQPSRQNLFQAFSHLLEGKGDPLKVASQLQDHDPLQMLDYVLSWLVDLLRLQLNSDSGSVINRDYAQQLMELREKTQMKKNVKLMEYVQHLRAQICEGMNFNKLMMLESIFIQWTECT